MQDSLLKGFFQWSAPDGKRPLQACNPPPLPPVKRQKRSSGEEHEEQPSRVQIQRLPQQEKPCLYPCVAYEGDIAIVKLGVGQMVMLEGWAMVQVVEGHAAMLGYSFPRGTEILVCSNSKLMEVVTIEARRGSYHEGQTDALGCHLKFASHRLGRLCASETSVSFTLEFVGSLGSSFGKKMDQQLSEQQNEVYERNEDNQPNLDIQNMAVDQLVEDSLRKRKSCGQNTESDKRQRVVEKLGIYPSSTCLPHKGDESIGSSTPVVANAMQRMLECLHLLGS